MADLLMLVGTLVFFVGVWCLIRPIARIGITDRRRAAQVLGAGFVVAMVGGALADTETQEPTALAPIGGISAPTTTTAAPPTTSTTTSTLATTTTLRDPVATVLEIVDGDTVVVEMPEGTEETVRLIGIDAPEGSQEGAADAAEAL